MSEKLSSVGRIMVFNGKAYVAEDIQYAKQLVADVNELLGGLREEIASLRSQLAESCRNAGEYANQVSIERANIALEIGRIMYHLNMNAKYEPVINPAYYQMLYDRLAALGFKEGKE